MNSSPERQIRKFNPGTFQSDEEVIAQFVVRNRELGVVLEVLPREHRFAVVPAHPGCRPAWPGEIHAAGACRRGTARRCRAF